jgi:hypothetical protein
MQDVECRLLRGIQLFLHCVDHMGAGVVLQQYSAISEFSLMLVLNLHTQLLKHLTAIICTDYVIT